MLKGYSKFLDVLERVEKLFLVVTVAVMLLVMIYQVILRYVFSAANAWSEELTRYLFIFQVMVAASVAIRRNSHLQIDVLLNCMKPRLKKISTIISTLVGIGFLCFLLRYSLDLVQTGASNLSVGLRVPMSVPYTCLPIGTVLMLLTSVEVVIKNLVQLRRGEEDAE